MTSGRLDTILMKKPASKRMAPGEVINKPALSFSTEIKCSMEIWPFDPVKVIPEVATSILMVDKIGIAFLVEIALFVALRACRKNALLIANEIIGTPLYLKYNI